MVPLKLLRIQSETGGVGDGIELGLPIVMAHTLRQRDRRQLLGELLATLTRSLDRRLDISLMRGAFEEMVRRFVPVRTIQLREVGSRWATRPEGAGAESIVVDVPGSDPSSQGLLEATFDPACGILRPEIAARITGDMTTLPSMSNSSCLPILRSVA